MPTSASKVQLLGRGRACGAAPFSKKHGVFLPPDPVTYYTPLHIAVLRNQPDVVELLVRHGADINRRDRVRTWLPGRGSPLVWGQLPPRLSPAVGGLLRCCFRPNKPVPAAVGGRRLV